MGDVTSMVISIHDRLRDLCRGGDLRVVSDAGTLGLAGGGDVANDPGGRVVSVGVGVGGAGGLEHGLLLALLLAVGGGGGGLLGLAGGCASRRPGVPSAGVP